jgi:hypothetical protein
MDALAFGCVLSEKVIARELVDGRRVLKAIKPKPWWSWKFKVNKFGEILWIEPTANNGADSARIPRRDVAIFTWAGKRGDPRGTSLLRPAYQPWNSKRQARTDHGKFVRRMASPMPVAKAPLATLPVPPDANGAEQSIFQFLDTLLRNFDNSTYAVLPATTEVDYLEPRTEGGTFLNSFAYDDRQIATAILGSSRAIMEAEFGSRADSESSQDIAGQFSRFLGAKLSRALQWEVFYDLVVENWGEEIADEFTPTIPIGAVEHQDKSALIGAWSAAGWTLHPKHLAAIDAELELDPRTEEDIRAEEERAAERARAAGLPKPGESADEEDKPTAQFAYDAPPPGPWHDADLKAGRAIVSATFPSAAALKRWEKGETPLEDRLAVVGWIVDDAKVHLRGLVEQLLINLPAPRTAERAEFAGGWETVMRWRDDVARFLRRVYLSGVLTLLGPRELTDVEWEALRIANEEQLDYLDGFAEDIITGRQPRDGTMGSRAGSYGDSVWVVSQAVQRAHEIAAGRTQERSRLGPSEKTCGGPNDKSSAPSCLSEQAKGWQPIGTLSLPGRRKCKGACKCHMEYR